MPLPSTDQEVTAIKGELDPLKDRLLNLINRYRKGSTEQKRVSEAFLQLSKVQDTLALLRAGF